MTDPARAAADPAAQSEARPAADTPMHPATAGGRPASPEHARVDPERPRDPHPLDVRDAFTGEDYNGEREAEMGRRVPSGQEDRVETGGDPATDPLRDNRASFDPATGAVHGPRLVEDGGEPSPPRP